MEEIRFLDLDEEFLKNMIFAVSICEDGLRIQGHRFEDDPELRLIFITSLQMVIKDLESGMKNQVMVAEVQDEEGNVVGETVLTAIEPSEDFKKRMN